MTSCQKTWSVFKHASSARLMESTGGLIGLKELATQGTSIECIEGEDDNTLTACIKDELNISLKKKFNKSLFEPVIVNAEQLAGLDLSKQCEHETVKIYNNLLVLVFI